MRVDEQKRNPEHQQFFRFSLVHPTENLNKN